ncbi:hypothetical protein BaRGS_00036666 [Batillaria attramentaria]|uniref:Uncharacterized protein n=1 Tax=Batillaria attramentaria TaxID=370345 RepID=A0ABD0JAR9_9CAEN
MMLEVHKNYKEYVVSGVMNMHNTSPARPDLYAQYIAVSASDSLACEHVSEGTPACSVYTNSPGRLCTLLRRSLLAGLGDVLIICQVLTWRKNTEARDNIIKQPNKPKADLTQLRLQMKLPLGMQSASTGHWTSHCNTCVMSINSFAEVVLQAQRCMLADLFGSRDVVKSLIMTLLLMDSHGLVTAILSYKLECSLSVRVFLVLFFFSPTHSVGITKKADFVSSYFQVRAGMI